MLPASGKFGLNRYVTSVGSLGYFDVDETQTAKFVITNAAPGNVFTIKGKINGQNNYIPIDTIIGAVTKTVDITQYDYIEVECTNYATLSTYVQIDGSGFATSLVNSPMGDINLSVSLIPSEDGVHIADKTTGIPLKVNNDGSINTVVTGGGDASATNQLVQIAQLNSIITNQNAMLAKLSLRYDEVSATEMYLGEGLFGALESEAKWQIKKIIIIGTDVVIKNASSTFDQVWNDRLLLSYV